MFGSYKVKYHPEGPEGPEWEVDFTPPFKRLRMFPDLEKALGEPLPKPDQLHTEEARAMLDKLCAKNNVECSAPRTAARLLDKVSTLLGFFVLNLKAELTILGQLQHFQLFAQKLSCFRKLRGK